MASPEHLTRLSHLTRFYGLLSHLTERIGGPHLLSELRGYRELPPRGVYFFFEPTEVRSDSGTGLRVVRVGTHALVQQSRSTLKQRLNQHRGTVSGGGNHRGSIFRLLVGQALISRGDVPPCHSWGVKSDPRKAAEALQMERRSLLGQEANVEVAVSRYIAAMPIVWLDVDDEPGRNSERGYIERNAIALLSNRGSAPMDEASSDWLGRSSNRRSVADSGLWNQRHVDDGYEPQFLNRLEARITNTG